MTSAVLTDAAGRWSNVMKYGPEHFGEALFASIDAPREEVIVIYSTDKRPAKARRKEPRK